MRAERRMGEGPPMVDGRSTPAARRGLIFARGCVYLIQTRGGAARNLLVREAYKLL
jgi:hypothetical protein